MLVEQGSLRKNIEPLLIEDDHLINRDEEKGRVFNVGGVLPQSLMIGPGLPRPRSENYGCRNSDFSLMDTEIARNQLHKLNVLKPMALDQSHLRVLKELSMTGSL